METATGKSGFLLYHDQRAFFCLLNDAEAKALILAVFDYETMRTEPGPISPAADMAFVAIRQTLDRNRVKHDAIVERRREYGRLGGLAKASLSQQELAKPSKASYTDTVTDSVTVTDTVKAKEKKNAYGELRSVLLTNEEHKSLLEKHGADKLARGIEILDGYIASKNKKYASHYAVMKADSWVWARLEEANAKRSSVKGPRNAEHASTIWIDQSENRRKVDF
jgi:hypothetical protein